MTTSYLRNFRPTQLKFVDGQFYFNNLPPLRRMAGSRVDNTNYAEWFGTRKTFLVGDSNGNVLGEVDGSSSDEVISSSGKRWPEHAYITMYPKDLIERDRMYMQRDLERKLLKTRKFVAYHEAGHAVVGHNVGIVIESISMRSQAFELDGVLNLMASTMATGVDFSGLPPTPEPAWATKLIQMNLAGFLAEELMFSHVQPERSGVDFQQAVNNGGFAFCANETEGSMNDLISSTRQLLIDCWPQVEAIATFLRSEFDLSRLQFLALLDQVKVSRSTALSATR